MVNDPNVPGPTGNFPRGKVYDDDEGELQIAIATDPEAGLVRVDFGIEVRWLAFPKDQAIAWGEAIIEKAKELPDPEPGDVG